MRAHQLIGACGAALAVSLAAPACGPSGRIGDDDDAGGMDGGEVGRDGGRDASVSADAGCVPADEACNRRDDDCDGRTDEDFDTTRDPMNCGACGIRCAAASPDCVPLPGGGASCFPPCAETEPTRCGLSCVDTSADVDHCGACSNACVAPPEARTTCAAGDCGFACDSRQGDCDGDADNGCETPLDTLTDCGSCGTACSRSNASETCSTGSCRIASCSSGYANCDGADTNGCETRLTSLSNCGACGRTCSLANATETCSTGSCRISSCNAGFADCNGVASDGCECAA